jgi:hypothetical protein
MLYEAKLKLFLDSEAKLAKEQPEKLFAKFFHTLTAGKLLPEEEQQTFTAIEILQDFNRLFRKNGITNVISLSKDGYRYYHDQAETDDDISKAMQSFHQQNDPIDAELFKDLFLSLEHTYQGLQIFIEVDIKRIHAVGEAPITIKLSGLIAAFTQQSNETETQLKARLKDSLMGDSYHSTVNQYRLAFEHFVDHLQIEIKKELNIKHIKSDANPSIVRPHKKGAKAPKRRSQSHSVFSGSYANSPATWLYAFIWMDLMSDMDVSAGSFDVLDESGQVLDSVTDPINAASSALFDPTVDLTKFDTDGGQTSTEEYQQKTESTSWLGSFGDGDGGSDGGSSCGAGCGGGCGS